MGLLSRLEVGDSLTEETTLAGYPALQSNLNPPTTRRPEFMKDWVLEAKLYTGVGTSAGDIRYFVRVERRQ